MCIAAYFSLILFLTSFIPLFYVWIVGCEAGLVVASKLKVSRLIKGSVNRVL